MPTIADVARLARVSIATASRVITGSVPVTPDRAAAVRKAAADLGYVPNERARELRRGSLRAVGFLVDDLSDPYFAGIFRGIRRRLDDSRCAVVAIEASAGAPAASETVLRLLRSSADAMIAADSAVLNDDMLAGLDRRNVRTVNFDGVAGIRGGEHEYLVRIHDRAGMRRLTEHLLGLGHVRIALVLGPPRRSSDRERSAGFAEAMEAAGAEPRVLTAEGWGSDDAARAVRDALAGPSPPTAIVAVEPRGADGVFDAARTAGLRVPHDLSIASFYTDADTIAGTAVTSLGDVREIVAALIARALDRSEAVAPVEGELAVVPGRTSAPPP